VAEREGFMTRERVGRQLGQHGRHPRPPIYPLQLYTITVWKEELSGWPFVSSDGKLSCWTDYPVSWETSVHLVGFIRSSRGVPMASSSIPRHKTAIRRGDFSRPVKCALRDGLIDPSARVFDFGCGRGEDLELLSNE